MGERKKAGPSMALVFLALVLTLTIQFGFSAANHHHNSKKTPTQSPSNRFNSLVFPVQGDVYPNGYFYTTMYMGNPPRPYYLDIDTGSNLTWVQCAAASSAKLLKAPHNPYKPNNNVLYCKDPICASVDQPKDYPCKSPDNQCDYEVHYADHGSSLGVLVRDLFGLKLTNGSAIGIPLAFGCGYDQGFSGPSSPPYVDGVLGLASGKSSIVSQLNGFGLIRNVISHCFSRQGKGFLVFGNDLLPKKLEWVPMLPNSLNHYMVGPMDLQYGGKTHANGLYVVFDSGSTYTYLNSIPYQTTLSLITKGLSGKPLSVVQDGNLPVCWKGAKLFGSIDAVKHYFSPLSLSFGKGKNAAYVLPPEAYLLITSKGNVCLGILNGTEANLGNLNVIGDISMQEKWVVYDIERKMIGWASHTCNKLS
ncbi:Nepenthesin [Bertholletia excelsa]